MNKKLKVSSLLLLFMLTGCYDTNMATAVLKDSGYSEFRFTGYAPFSCPSDATYATGFEGYSHDGRMVKGAVCSNLTFSDNTIHLNESDL